MPSISIFDKDNNRTYTISVNFSTALSNATPDVDIPQGLGFTEY